MYNIVLQSYTLVRRALVVYLYQLCTWRYFYMYILSTKILGYSGVGMLNAHLQIMIHI